MSHEALDDSMKRDAVEVVVEREEHERIDSDRGIALEQIEHHATSIGLEHCDIIGVRSQHLLGRSERVGCRGLG